MADDGKKKDYEIGYGRPPKHTRFPHQTRGTGPRTRKRKPLSEHMLEELHGTTSLRNPKTGALTKIETARQIARNVRNKALQNDQKAIGVFLALEGGLSRSDAESALPAPENFSKDDKAIMARFAKKFLAAQQKRTPSPAVAEAPSKEDKNDDADGQ